MGDWWPNAATFEREHVFCISAVLNLSLVAPTSQWRDHDATVIVAVLIPLITIIYHTYHWGAIEFVLTLNPVSPDGQDNTGQDETRVNGERPATAGSSGGD